MVEVIVEWLPGCPRCRLLLPRVARLCRALGIPFRPRLVGGHIAPERDYASRTFAPEWIERWGGDRGRRILRDPRKRAVAEMLSRSYGAPNIIVRWHDGARVKEIVIRGFTANPEDPRAESFFRNLAHLLLMVRRVEENTLGRWYGWRR